MIFNSNTFTTVQKNASEIWNYQYFVIIYEYELCVKYRLLPLPTPLNLIDFCLLFLKFLFKTISDFNCVNKKELNNIESQSESGNENSHNAVCFNRKKNPEITVNTPSADNSDNENDNEDALGDSNLELERLNLGVSEGLSHFNRRITIHLESSHKKLFPQPPDKINDHDKNAILGR